MAENTLPVVPPKQIRTEYPIIDTDPHFNRVFKYARPADYGVGLAVAAIAPAAFATMEHYQPAFPGPATYGKCLRLASFIGATAGFLTVYQRSSHRFLGLTENVREADMDMREMVHKVKHGEPLYGKSSLSEYMQGVAARNSRYSVLFIHAMPWFNFVNHDQHGVDTAKYYQQAERELEAERLKMGGKSQTA